MVRLSDAAIRSLSGFNAVLAASAGFFKASIVAFSSVRLAISAANCVEFISVKLPSNFCKSISAFSKAVDITPMVLVRSSSVIPMTVEISLLVDSVPTFKRAYSEYRSFCIGVISNCCIATNAAFTYFSFITLLVFAMYAKSTGLASLSII